MITHTRMAIAAALIILALTLACGFGNGSDPNDGYVSIWYCAESTGVCWVVCEE